MLQSRVLLPAMALVGTVVAVPIAHAQVSITPLIGGYVPASNVNQVQGDAINVAKTRDGTLSLGGNVDFGMFRATVAYASGTTIKNVNKFRITDVVVKCVHAKIDASELGTSLTTIHQTIEPNREQRIIDFDLGAVPSGTANSSCSATGFTVLE